MKSFKSYLIPLMILMFAGAYHVSAAGDIFATPGSICKITITMPTLEIEAQKLNPQVLKLALKAYGCAVAAGMDKQKVLSIIDFTMPSTQKRLWIFDLDKNRVLFNTWVAHGKGSGEVVPTKFSNVPESYQSSFGLFLTGHTYQGKYGTSMKLYGLEKGYNDKAAVRTIVMHGAPYVSEQAAKSGRLGRSLGCPAVTQKLADPIEQTIKNGSILFAYFPDPGWLENSKYLNCASNGMNADYWTTDNSPM